MELHYILFGLTTISLFFSGYSFRKKSIIGILITTLLAQVPFIIDIKTIGISEYGKNLVNSTVNSFVIAIIYIVIIWTMGYIIGGINIKKKEMIDDFPGKVTEYVRIDLDGNK